MTKLYLNANRPSFCCRAPQLLVRSRQGGFVTCNCSKCGRPNYVGREQLPAIRCEKCGTAMESGKQWSNYCYKCGRCGHSFELWTRLPWWHEHFARHGIATPDEFDQTLFTT